MRAKHTRRRYDTRMSELARVLSRRTFGRLAVAGAALAAVPVPPLLAGNTIGDPPAADEATVVRLSANENPYGPSPAAFKAMTDAFKLTWRYPDEMADLVIRDLAKHHAINPDTILLGDGSSEILRLAGAALTGKSRGIVMADPTFEVMAIYAGPQGVPVTKVKLDAAYAHDLAKMRDVAGAGLIYVCNPNNPTGSITPKAAMRAFLDAVPPSTYVLVDEAYHHYATGSDYESVVGLAKSHPNLIVARTFSKIYGMAGLRLGYAVAHPDVLDKLVRQSAWDSINVMALAAARASLADPKQVEEGRRRNSATRKMVVDALAAIGHKTVPSETNFIMVDTGRDVKLVGNAMRARGVEVGRFFPALPHHLRVTIGTKEQMEKFLAAYRAVMAS